ncbi:MAG: Na+/H+ antiporter [Janthinobacterium lividum]
MVELSTGGTGGLLLLMLLAVAIFGSLARVLKVPYPILLVVSGIGLSLLPRMPRFALPPDTVFLVFLPPLLYSAAWTLSWREFQRNFKNIAMLAFGLVLATVLLLTFFARDFLPGFDWKAGLLLGAVVAATDAIAATSIASRMGLPHSVVALLEAESLVNDATGLLALQFGVTILLTGRTPTFVEGIGRFIFLTVGGVLIGLLVGVVVAKIEEFIDDGPIEIVLSVLVPYAAYVLGERVHVSGAMAVIACGMYMSRQSVNFMSAAVRLQSTAVWDALTFVLNGIVFLLLGLQLPFVLAEIRGIPLRILVLYGVGFSLSMIGLRVAWVFLDALLSGWTGRWLSKGPTQSVRGKRQLAVVGWGGMRGVLSLAAAVSLPLTTADGPFRQRSLIIFLAFCLILSTLVVQGLSLPLLIRKLGLAGQSSLHFEEQEARRTMLREALAYLEQRRQRPDTYDTDMLNELTAIYRGRLESIPAARNHAPRVNISRKQRHQAILDVLEIERATLLRLRDEQHIDDEVLRTLQRELDLSESRVHTSVA